jgi:predicted ATP-dependent Lon-type protease
LFWNAQRKQVGVIGFWDVVAFDEVGEGVVVRDREMYQLMKQYMANGNSGLLQDLSPARAAAFRMSAKARQSEPSSL